MTHWLLRAIPAAVLLVTGVVVALGGLMLPAALRATNGPCCHELAPETIVLIVAMIGAGPGLIWIARGVWRTRPWRTHIALAGLTVAIGWMAWLWSRPRQLNNVSHLDTGGQQLALLIMPYAIALVCLIVAEVQMRRTRVA